MKNKQSLAGFSGKRTLLIVVVALLLLIVGGGVMYAKVGNKNSKVGMADAGTPKPTDLFTSIKDALSKKMTLVCEFNDDKGTSTKSYIKNGAVRVSSMGQSGEFIMKDNKMYMWDDKTKQGFVYDVPQGEVSQTGTTEVSQSDSYLGMIDKYKDSCKVATVEDSYFVPPTEVNFQDMTKMLEDIKMQIPQTPAQ